MGVVRLSDVVRAFGTTRMLELDETFLCVRKLSRWRCGKQDNDGANSQKGYRIQVTLVYEQNVMLSSWRAYRLGLDGR